MTDEAKTEAPGHELHCGTCVHQSPGYSGPLCGAIHDHIEQRHARCKVSPHNCEHHSPSDAHRLAKATEAQASALSFLAALMAEMLDEPEEDEEGPTIALTCDACYRRFDVPADVESCTCPGCAKGFVLARGRWEDA